MLARWTYGATIDKGLEFYDRAFKLAPNDILINYQYGLGLAAYDADEYRDKIEAAWKRAVAAPAQNAYEEASKKRAGELLALLNGKDKKALKAKLDSYMGIPE
jgi:tetratricopeptide (TPR) repeat protein